MKKKIFKLIKGFTLVELVITIAIFAAMTTYLLAKYGKFNQTLLLTNLAYDVALTIRTAQSFGLNVKSVSTSESVAPSFDFPYGAHFDITGTNNKSFIFFADQNSMPEGKFGDGVYDPSPDESSLDEKINSYSIKRGSIISELLVCVGEGGTEEVLCANADTLDISFKRPDPAARIYANGVNTIEGSKINYAEITLLATDDSEKRIIVRTTGQIAITNAGIEGFNLVSLE